MKQEAFKWDERTLLVRRSHTHKAEVMDYSTVSVEEMQRHYSTVSSDEMRAGRGKVIDIATGRERRAA